MRKLCLVLCLVLMLGVLFGCDNGGGTDDPVVPDQDDFLGLQDGEEFTTDKEIKISFLRPTGNGAQENWWAVAIKEFNEKYKGKIVVTETSLARDNANGYEQQISLRAAEGSLPDVLYLDGPYVSNYAYADILVPLDNYLTETYLSDFLPNVIDQGTYNDRLYALSIVDSAVVIAYNKQIFAEANITVPTKIEDAWTWSKIKEVAESLTKDLPSGKRRYGLNITGDAGEWMSYAFSPLWSKGTMAPDGKSSTGYLDGETGVKAAEFLQSLTKKAINKDGSVGDFTNPEGLAAMWLMGTQEISNINLIPEFKDNWGVIYYPKNDDGTHTSPCGGWTLGMTSNCSEDKRVAACEFIKFLTSVDKVESFAEETCSPPARRSVLDIMDVYNTDENFKKIKEQIIATATLRAKTIGYAEFTPQFSEALNDIIGSGVNAKDRLTMAAQTIDQKISKLK